jgi:hypothetical protein
MHLANLRLGEQTNIAGDLSGAAGGNAQCASERREAIAVGVPGKGRDRQRQPRRKGFSDCRAALPERGEGS